MFKSKENRFVTKKIQEEVPYPIQQYLFHLIDEKVSKGEVELDYLQVFELTPDANRGTVNIVHRQEEPFSITHHDMIFTLKGFKYPDNKIWVIDDGENQTMLFPSDY